MTSKQAMKHENSQSDAPVLYARIAGERGKGRTVHFHLTATRDFTITTQTKKKKNMMFTHLILTLIVASSLLEVPPSIPSSIYSLVHPLLKIAFKLDGNDRYR